METQREYHYTYYSYEEWGRGYFGSRSCKCLPEKDVNYFGSFKDKKFKPTQKIILKSDYNTREEADADEVILHNYFEVDINPHFANRARQTSSKFRLPKERRTEVCSNAGKIGGKKSKKLGKGIFSLTTEERRTQAYKNMEENKGMFSLSKEQQIENSRKSGKITYDLGVGVHGQSKEEMSRNGKKGGKIAGNKCKQFGLGICGLTKEQRIEAGKKGGKISGPKSGKICKEKGIGIFGMTKEEKIKSSRKGGKNAGIKCKELRLGIFGMTEDEKTKRSEKSAKITNSQKWQCTETGYISTSGPLTRYQKARGIDTSKRIRLE